MLNTLPLYFMWLFIVKCLLESTVIWNRSHGSAFSLGQLIIFPFFDFRHVNDGLEGGFRLAVSVRASACEVSTYLERWLYISIFWILRM